MLEQSKDTSDSPKHLPNISNFPINIIKLYKLIKVNSTFEGLWYEKET